MNILLFSIGAALGAPLRFWVDNKFRPRYKFPVGIFIANILGSFIIGLGSKGNLPINNYLILGFCGALTTWSTFIVDLYFGVMNRAYKSTALNLSLSIVLGLLAFHAGNSLV